MEGEKSRGGKHCKGREEKRRQISKPQRKKRRGKGKKKFHFLLSSRRPQTPNGRTSLNIEIAKVLQTKSLKPPLIPVSPKKPYLPGCSNTNPSPPLPFLLLPFIPNLPSMILILILIHKKAPHPSTQSIQRGRDCWGCKSQE